MKKLLALMTVALMTLLVLAMLTFGQTQTPASGEGHCTLTLAQSPTIRGIKLGMTSEEVLALFPGRSEAPEIRAALSDAPKNFGVARFTVSPSISDNSFAGVNLLVFEFLDNHLTSFYVGYRGPEWNNVTEFISVLSTSLKLPTIENWEPRGAENFRTLKCAGFDVTAVIAGDGGNSNYVKVSNPLMPQTVTARQAELKEKARQAFKP